MVLEMEENGELEEGEACYDNANIDPDTDLSYIVRASSVFVSIKFKFKFNILF